MSTNRVKLKPHSRDDALAMVERLSPEDRAQVSPDWLARVRASAPDDPWTFGCSVVLSETGALVGQCGFKGPPVDGVVEIAYGIDADHRGKGYATEAAEALMRLAFASDQVRLVIAHTLPEANASTRILTKCGFRHAGEVIDPEDGRVWRWEKPRDARS